MAPMKTLDSNHSSSHSGESVDRQANVLASCYVVNAAASLKGFHYCTTLAAGKNKETLPPLLPYSDPRKLLHFLPDSRC